MSTKVKLLKHPTNNDELYLLELEDLKVTLHKSKDSGNNWTHKVSHTLTGTNQQHIDAVIRISTDALVDVVISTAANEIETIIFNGTTMTVASSNATFSTGIQATITAGATDRFVALIR